MDDIKILDAVERYIKGELNPDERLHFENLRKTNPEVDQLVVEHTLFLQQMNRFGIWKKFRTTLHDVHTNLAEQGKINSAKLKGKAKVIYLWKRYRRVAAIAASIAVVTTFGVIAATNYFSPKADKSKLLELDRKLKEVTHKQDVQNSAINELEKKVVAPNIKKVVGPNIQFKAGGTGFVIDARGWLVTSAHIVRNSKHIVVMNGKGDQFNAVVAKFDLDKDIAILKIDDDNFKPLAALPYGIRKSSSDLAEPIFTLGYPRNEIVFSEGYLSAKTGFNGDTLSCQLGIAANKGNSGGPVFNRDGEVIGVISSKEVESEGVAFAIQSKYIYNAIEDLKKDTSYQSLKLQAKSNVRGLDQKQQVKKIQDYVFLVKAD